MAQWPIVLLSKILRVELLSLMILRKVSTMLCLLWWMKRSLDLRGTASVADMQAFDYWCNGDIALWKKVANQLKLRLAMRIVKGEPYIGEAKSGGSRSRRRIDFR